MSSLLLSQARDYSRRSWKLVIQVKSPPKCVRGNFQNRTSFDRVLMKKNHSIPEDVLDYIFSFLESNRDRKTASLVCKYWYMVESRGRKKIIIRNCYALSHLRLISRFPKVRALTLKGYPHVDDSDSIPQNWGGFAYPWIEMLAESCSSLEELKLKRMTVTDQTLELISHSFPNFKSLILIHCRGYSSNGLAAIAANCRFLEVLDLKGNAVGSHQWLNCFPESFTSLVSLNFADDLGEVDLAALEKLVGRCPNLKSLKLSKAVPLATLVNILVQAPQLVDLGIGSFVIDLNSEHYTKLCHAVLNCKLVCNLSGLLHFLPSCLPAIIPICSNLIFLNLRNSYNMLAPELSMLIRECRKLQRLWVLDCIGDKGLKVVASTCKELQELRIFASPLRRGRGTISENGMISISIGCPKLHSLQYLCLKMTNAALATVATNCPNLSRFSLHIIHSRIPYYVTTQPFDEGLGAIVHSCKKLKYLSLSGLLTDQVFLYMGMYAEQLETLIVEFSGESDTGILYLLNGCSKLRKLVIMNSPIGDAALLAAADKYERLQFFWMSSCNVTLEGCQALLKKVPKLNIEIMKDGPLLGKAELKKMYKIYMYRSLDGPRNDAPGYVCTLDEHF